MLLVLVLSTCPCRNIVQSFFSRNTDDARNAALIFLGLGFGMLIACIMQQARSPARPRRPSTGWDRCVRGAVQGAAAVVGERLTRQLRVQCYRSLIRQASHATACISYT